MLILKPHQLTVLTTSKCTAACGHCSMNSGPSRRDRLTFELIRQAIDNLHILNKLRVVIFAGGEPTLLGEHLLNAIAHADSLGILTRVVTNAYWAVTPERARVKLIQLREAGLQELNISADDYHLPYIPFERVEHAWHASKGLGFQAVVIANCWGPNSTITPQYIMDRLGEQLPLRFDDDGHSNRLGTPASDGTLYQLSNAYVQRIGRAVQTIAFEDVNFPQRQEDLEGGCPWAIQSAALSPRNHLVACCGIEAEGNEVLDFGELTHVSAEERVYEADDNLLLNAIALRGPMYLKRFVQERAPEISFREKYATVCEVCEHLVTRPNVVMVLRQHAAELASEVLAMRTQLGEEA